MNRTTGKFIAGVLMAGLLGLPAGLSAKQRRGVTLVVTKLDGAQVSGELIAVRPDSILLLRNGADLSILRVKIHSVQILRRSKRGSGILLGFLAGASGGFLAGLGYGDTHVHGMETPLKAGAFFGGLGALIGFLVSPGGGVDSALSFTGLSSVAAAKNWKTLHAYSRAGQREKTARRP
jgi:hypothetical protein